MGEIKNLFRASNVSMYILLLFFPVQHAEMTFRVRCSLEREEEEKETRGKGKRRAVKSGSSHAHPP